VKIYIRKHKKGGNNKNNMASSGELLGPTRVQRVGEVNIYDEIDELREMITGRADAKITLSQLKDKLQKAKEYLDSAEKEVEEAEKDLATVADYQHVLDRLTTAITELKNKGIDVKISKEEAELLGAKAKKRENKIKSATKDKTKKKY